MAIYRVSYSFGQLPDAALDDFVGAVITSMAGSVAYPTPPVTMAQLSTLKTAFEDALAATVQGGTAATAAKNVAREDLLEALRKDAAYVQINCNNDLATLLNSGYDVASNNRTPNMLEKVQIIGVDNVQTGELKVRIKPITNAKSFDGRIKAGNGEFGPPISFKNSKSIIFTSLTPGATYTMQVCAVGGTTGMGDWSDPTSRMAI